MPDEASSAKSDFHAAIDACAAAMEGGDIEAQQQAMVRALEAAGDVDEDTSEWSVLNRRAERCKARGDWHGAERAYLAKLALPDLDPAWEFKTHSELAYLNYERGRPDESLACARRATAAARGGELDILIAMALAREAAILLSMENPQAAEAALVLVAEGLGIAEENSMFANLQAELLTLRARCALAGQNFEDAESDLEQSLALLAPQANNPIAGGVQSNLAALWKVMADLRCRQGDPHRALQASTESVAACRRIAAMPHCAGPDAYMDVARSLRGHATYLRAIARLDEAAKADADAIKSSNRATFLRTSVAGGMPPPLPTPRYFQFTFGTLFAGVALVACFAAACVRVGPLVPSGFVLLVVGLIVGDLPWPELRQPLRVAVKLSGWAVALAGVGLMLSIFLPEVR